jgi:hypothetical protein
LSESRESESAKAKPSQNTLDTKIISSYTSPQQRKNNALSMNYNYPSMKLIKLKYERREN